MLVHLGGGAHFTLPGGSMALTDSEKAQVRRWLGYPDINRLNQPELESAMDALSPEGEAVAREILVELDKLNEEIGSARSATRVTRVEDVWFSGGEGLETMRQDARRLVRDLANLLGVDPKSLPFSSGYGCGVMQRG